MKYALVRYTRVTCHVWKQKLTPELPGLTPMVHGPIGLTEDLPQHVGKFLHVDENVRHCLRERDIYFSHAYRQSKHTQTMETQKR